MHERLLAYVRKHDLMRAGQRVGVAVSGGADSVALLRLLLDLRGELGVVLAVVHFHHKLRGEASDADEAFVRALAEEHGLEFFCDAGDTRAHAAAHGCGIEAAARELRYGFFWRLMVGDAEGGRAPTASRQVRSRPGEGAGARHLQNTLDRIATAHTMDDQAETVVMRFARGAGTRGVAGIHPVVRQRALGPGLWASGDPTNKRPEPNAQSPTPAIVRPLLEFRRAQLRHYLKRASQAWREDASNQDIAFVRNRLRQEVMPKLRQLNPAIEQVLSETAEIARAEEEYWRGVVAAALKEITAKHAKERKGNTSAESAEGQRTQSVDRLSVTELLRLPVALRRRVLREFAERQGLRLEFHHVEQVLEVAGDESTRHEKRVELPGNWDACLAGSELRLNRRAEKSEKQDYEYPLAVPGEVWVEPARVRVQARVTDTGPRLKACELRVRNWRPGDRYWPAHMASEKKVKELLQDRRVPVAARAHWPVVVAAATGQIVWLPGFPYPEGWATEGEPGVVLEIEPQSHF